MEEANGAAIPMSTSVRLDLAEELGEREVDPKEYQAIVGSLMYITLATRPDSIRSFGTESIADHCLHFNGNDGEITGYTDSDWANDSADRKSQGGHVFLCNGGAISWQSRKQDLVALSTTEAEY